MWSRDRVQPSRRSLRQTDNLGARSRRIISAARDRMSWRSPLALMAF